MVKQQEGCQLLQAKGIVDVTMCFFSDFHWVLALHYGA
jgi:hypothetical protein